MTYSLYIWSNSRVELKAYIVFVHVMQAYGGKEV
jgi:hypothetical protein